MDFLIPYYYLKKRYTLLIIIGGHILLMYISNRLLINETVFYNTYSDQLTYDRSILLFENLRKIAWFAYIFLPISLIIKFVLVGTCVFCGLFFIHKEIKASFSLVFGVVMSSEVIFIIAGIFKLLWFIFFSGNYDLDDLTFFYPLSLSNFFNHTDVARYWIFPLQTLNLFQLGYIIIISYGLSIRLEVDRDITDRVLLFSYLPGLFVMIALFMFLSIGNTL